MKFKRSDGIDFEAEEGSEAFKLMEKDGRFERVVDSDNEKEVAESSEPQAKPLAKMNKLELLSEAEGRGLQLVPDEVTKAQIIAAIEEADAKAIDESGKSDDKTADAASEAIDESKTEETQTASE